MARKLMDADDPAAQAPIEDLAQSIEQRDVLLVEQAAGGVAHQAPARPHEVEGHERGDDRVEPGEAGQADEDETDDDADARPEVREHVLAVGDEGERIRAPAGPDEEEAEHEVDEARRDHDGEARPEHPDLDTADQALRDLVHDEHGRERDEPALERGREELDLPVAVGMAAVGRAPREDEAAQREHRGDHVDDGLERVGQDGRRAREPVGRVLRAQQHHRHAERDQPRPQADTRVVANRWGNRGGDVHSEDDTPGVRPREPGREWAPGARRAAWSPPSPR